MRTDVAVVGGRCAGIVAAGLQRAGVANALLGRGARVFAASPGRLEALLAGRPTVVLHDRLVLATGARHRTVAFEGWHLDGVVACDEIGPESVRPGARAVVVGTPALVANAATSLRGVGVEVVGCFDATRGWAFLSASGEGGVERVRLGRMDRSGRQPTGAVRDLDVDVVCTAFGLVPAIELAQLLGCALEHDERRGGWYPRYGDRMETSVQGVFVAGAVTGAFDVASATAQARAVVGGIVGGVAADPGAVPSPLAPGVSGAPLAESTVACPCEHVTVGEVVAAAGLCGHHPRAIKLATRAGMGSCQGRRCSPVIADVLHRHCGVHGPIPPPRAQVPVVPVPAGTLLSTATGLP